MASYSKSARSYSDIHQMFERAGASGSVTLEFATKANATTWVGRAHAYRVLLRKQNEAAGREFASDFDHLMVRRATSSNIVRIEPRGFDFRVLDGEQPDRVTLAGPSPLPHDLTEAEQEAAAFLEAFERGDLK